MTVWIQSWMTHQLEFYINWTSKKSNFSWNLHGIMRRLLIFLFESLLQYPKDIFSLKNKTNKKPQKGQHADEACISICEENIVYLCPVWKESARAAETTPTSTDILITVADMILTKKFISNRILLNGYQRLPPNQPWISAEHSAEK